MKYLDRWKKEVDEQLKGNLNQWGRISGYPGVMKSVAEKGGRFSDWHMLAMPGNAVEDNLIDFIFIAVVYPDHEYCKIFLNWANEAADRALADERFQIDPEVDRSTKYVPGSGCRGWKVEGVYPGNHGETLAAACLSRALRDNSELKAADLLQAADEIVETALYGGSANWIYIPQSWYLRCVRLCLLAGRIDKAQFLLKNIRRKFKHTYVHQQWLQVLCNAIEAAGEGPLASEAVDQFQEFFDEIRNPEIRGMPSDKKDGTNLFGSINLLRLELAALKQQYILRQPLAGNWRKVLESISE